MKSVGIVASPLLPGATPADAGPHEEHQSPHGVDEHRADEAAKLGRLLCVVGAALGAGGLAGWLFDIAWLAALAPDQPPMVPEIAMSLVLLGGAGALRHGEPSTAVRRALAMVFATAVLIFGAATLGEYVLGLDLGIDGLPIRSRAGTHPGRPSPPTAWTLALLAGAILVFDSRPRARLRLPEWLALLAWLTSYTALIGQMFGAGTLYRLADAGAVGVGVPTALSLLLISAGLLLERPNAGLMRLVSSAGPGGMLLRYLGLAAIFAPLGLGPVVARLLVAMGVDSGPLAFAIMSVLMTVTSVVLLTATAAPLNRAHDALESSRARTRELIEQAPEGIVLSDGEGRCLDVNSACCRMLGRTREEMVGPNMMDLILEQDLPRVDEYSERLRKGGVEIAEWSLRHKDGSYVPIEVSGRLLPDGRWQGFLRDIRERKRAEAALRHSQERFELALRGADLATWDWNIETGEVIFDRRWAEIRSRPFEEIRPRFESWLADIHPDDVSRVRETLRAHLRGEVQEYASEHRVATKSGEWKWVLGMGKVFARDADGRPIRMVGTELDITVRKGAEAALRLSEAKFSGILSISADAIVSVDEAQRITMFNEGAEKIFGYTRTDAIGATLDTLIPERLRAAHRRHVDSFAREPDVARRMGSRPAGIVGRRKDGKEFPADAAISKIDVGGKTTMTVTVRDVSDQRRAESEQRFLSEAGRIFATTLDYEDTLTNVACMAVRELADVCVVVIADEEGERRRQRVFRRSAEGGPCEEVTAPPLLVEPPWLVSVLETHQPVFAEAMRPSALGLPACLPADDPPRAGLLAVPLVMPRRGVGAIGFVSFSRTYEHSDARFAEALAERAALALEKACLYRSAQRATQARDDILGIVAHDLRNPLSTILMQAQLLGGRVADSACECRRSAERIERAATRMNRLIQDLLDVTQMEAGRLSVVPRPEPVARVVTDAVEAQRTLGASRSIEIRPDLPPNLGNVWVDRDRLLQALENLIGNAAKFTSPGGRITVGAAPRGADVLFSITDTGRGIAEADLPHVFDRFWRAARAEHTGAGLGLAIVKGIVTAHGGRVWVESTLGRGTTFFFTIPKEVSP